MLRDIKYFFLISRPINIAISLVSFGVACFVANDHSWEFFLRMPFWATLLTIAGIAATGYWINDVYDFRIDRINKPNRTIVNAILSVKKVMTIYIGVTVLVLLGSLIYFGWYLDKIAISFINFLSVGLLFVYASLLKRLGVPGNLVIAFLILLVILLAGYLYRVNMRLIWMMVFAFQITFIREITKDVEDLKGDMAFNLRTLPIQIGIKHTQRILWVLYVIFLISCSLPIVYHYMRFEEWLIAYALVSLVLVQIPTILLLRYMLKSSEEEEFGHQSRYLKFLMVSGIVSLLFL